MSGFAQFPGCDVRAKLDHPVIDADAHVLECEFALDDFLAQVAGSAMVERSRARMRGNPYKFETRTIWWGVPSGKHTGDRAMAMLPKLFRARMDEAGIDFAHCYTTNGIPGLYIGDDELRQATCRALNTMYADMFNEVGDRVRPVAVIPTFTPEEAIAELDHAVLKLGHKAIMIGTEIRRPHSEIARAAPQLAAYSESTRSIAMDAPYDYDPFWRRCVELGVAPVCHTAARGSGYRASPTNYVFNHLGSFAQGADFFCRALFFGGVTRRFPTLNFGFLEGGVAWAMGLLNDIVEHFEKRNRDTLLATLDPAALDVDLLARLFDEYGNAYLTGERIRAAPHHRAARPERPDPFDEFEACGMREVADLKPLFCDNFYFGCEADDRMMSVAFNRRLSPVGAKLKAMFGSDIGHWDVMEAKTVLSEAWSLVEGRLLTPADFRELMFVNPASLHLGMNPKYFAGTVLEDAARSLPTKGAAGRNAATAKPATEVA
ncbi:MAG: amidohydrolase family protein [Burkholderiales bacterium]|nr:amidohydrolase family protein [Burkholderiales bacterium]